MTRRQAAVLLVVVGLTMGTTCYAARLRVDGAREKDARIEALEERVHIFESVREKLVDRLHVVEADADVLAFRLAQAFMTPQPTMTADEPLPTVPPAPRVPPAPEPATAPPVPSAPTTDGILRVLLCETGIMDAVGEPCATSANRVVGCLLGLDAFLPIDCGGVT